MVLSWILPAHNESDSLRDLSYIRALLESGDQVIVSENGSRDDTLEILSGIQHPGFSLISHLEGGKGAALRRAAPLVTGDRLILLDIDLIGYALDIRRLALDSNPSSYVLPNRFHPRSHYQKSSMRFIASKLYLVLARSLRGIRAPDIQAGVKIGPRKGLVEAILSSRSNKWFIDTEIVEYIEKRDLHCIYPPIEIEDHHASSINILRDGWHLLFELVRYKR